MLDEAEEDIQAYRAFPQTHGRKIRSTNPLERLNREIGRQWARVGKRYLSLVSPGLLAGNTKE